MEGARGNDPADILTFWREAGPDRWFKKDAAFDAEVHRRFLGLWESAATGHLASWQTTDDGTLALIIVLDQFPRNMFRGDPCAFASDKLARDTAISAIERGADMRVDPALRQFLYMPLMHSELMADQKRCVTLFRTHGDPKSLESAEDHAEIIQRFGRFPHRNRVLRRTTTPDEQAFLDARGFSG